MTIPLVAVVDAETLSTSHNAALLSIGAVIRDFNTGEQVDTFYANIIPQTSIDAGLDVSESTKAWWVRQGKAAQDVLSVDQRPLTGVLTRFAHWLTGHKVQYVLGNGPRADNQWLESAYNAVSLTCPFKYWGDLDMRTLTFIGTYILNMPHWHSTFEGVKHHALHDAINEGEFCNAVIQKLKQESNKMAEYTLSIKTESTSELSEIVAKLNGGQTTVAVTNSTPATVTVAVETDEAVNSTPPAVDVNGLPWDERIHAGTKAVNADGSWKKRRGVDDAVYNSVISELTPPPAPTAPVETPALTAPVETPALTAPVETPAPTVPVETPAPANVNRVQEFQQIVKSLQESGSQLTPDYMPKYHGVLVQSLLNLSGVKIVPEASQEQMQKMYSLRDQIVANMASITAGVPVADLIK